MADAIVRWGDREKVASGDLVAHCGRLERVQSITASPVSGWYLVILDPDGPHRIRVHGDDVIAVRRPDHKPEGDNR